MKQNNSRTYYKVKLQKYVILSYTQKRSKFEYFVLRIPRRYTCRLIYLKHFLFLAWITPKSGGAIFRYIPKRISINKHNFLRSISGHFEIFFRSCIYILVAWRIFFLSEKSEKIPQVLASIRSQIRVPSTRFTISTRLRRSLQMKKVVFCLFTFSSANFPQNKRS